MHNVEYISAACILRMLLHNVVNKCLAVKLF
jgi:hypothetical protein